MAGSRRRFGAMAGPMSVSELILTSPGVSRECPRALGTGSAGQNSHAGCHNGCACSLWACSDRLPRSTQRAREHTGKHRGSVRNRSDAGIGSDVYAAVRNRAEAPAGPSAVMRPGGAVFVVFRLTIYAHRARSSGMMRSEQGLLRPLFGSGAKVGRGLRQGSWRSVC